MPQLGRAIHSRRAIKRTRSGIEFGSLRASIICCYSKTALKQARSFEKRTGSCDPISEAEIDEALEESFPASDPLPWTLGFRPHCRDDKAKDKEAGDDKAEPN